MPIPDALKVGFRRSDSEGAKHTTEGAWDGISMQGKMVGATVVLMLAAVIVMVWTGGPSMDMSSLPCVATYAMDNAVRLIIAFLGITAVSGVLYKYADSIRPAAAAAQQKVSAAVGSVTS